MTRTIFSSVLIIALSGALGGCSNYSRSSRQQRAYEKYVRKSSVARQKQRSHFKTETPQMPSAREPGEPVESTEQAPEAVPSDDSQ